MAIKELQVPPYAWKGIKSQRITESQDMSSILLNSTEKTANTWKANKPILAKPLNALAAEWNPTMSSLTTSLNSTKTPHHFMLATNTKDKSKLCLNQASLNDDFLRSRSSLALPVLHASHQRNGGYTFFSEGNDHECFHEGDEQDCPPPRVEFMDSVTSTKIKSQLASKRKQLQKMDEEGNQGHWIYFDSGASRTVINADSPLRPLLTQVTPTTGSCTVGSGDQLPYVESGVLSRNNYATVVDGLKFDLYSGISAAKRGISAAIDYDTRTGENLSYTFCKETGEVTPLVERRQGVLELPLHLSLSRVDTTGLLVKDDNRAG